MITSSAGELRTSADVYISELGESSCELDAVPKFFKNALPAIASHGSVVSFCVRVLPPEVDVAWTVCGRDITNESKGFTVSTLVPTIHRVSLSYVHGLYRDRLANRMTGVVSDSFSLN